MKRKVDFVSATDISKLKDEINKFFEVNDSPRWSLLGITDHLNGHFLAWFEFENTD